MIYNKLPKGKIYERRFNHMSNKNQTSKSVASKASKVLKSPTASKTCKSLAGSALSQTKKK